MSDTTNIYGREQKKGLSGTKFESAKSQIFLLSNFFPSIFSWFIQTRGAILNHEEWNNKRSYYHPLSENHDFFRIKPLLDIRPVCKLKFVYYGQVEKNTEHSIFLGLWRPDEVREQLFLNNQIEKWLIF